MSRSRIFVFRAAIVGVALTSVPALAQQGSTPAQSAGVLSDRAIAERMLGNNGRVTKDTSRNACLRTIRQGEIVVCAPETDQFRVPSTAQDDPTGAAGTRDGRLHTPDVAGGGIFKGKPTATFGSVEQPYIIDLSTIPEAPAGSDADKIAKGEIRAP